MTRAVYKLLCGILPLDLSLARHRFFSISMNNTADEIASQLQSHELDNRAVCP